MSVKIIGVGEVLWDLLPSGPKLGGAPANFAYHARQLGAESRVITRVGRDPRGWQILEDFGKMGIRDGTVQLDDRLPTGTASVVLDALGVPQFTINSNVAWDNIDTTAEALTVARQANAICFGTLAQRSPASATTIQRLVAATPAGSLRVFDVNLRQKFYTAELVKHSLEIANVVKLNEYELTVLGGLLGLPGEPRRQIEQLARRYDLRLVALTRGENGSLLHQAGRWSDLPGGRVEIVDTVGAGDAFTAALVMGLLNGFDLPDIHRNAADIAAYVCSRPGATPVLPDHLLTAFAAHCASA